MILNHKLLRVFIYFSLNIVITQNGPHKMNISFSNIKKIYLKKNDKIKRIFLIFFRLYKARLVQK